jgi:hypothetical protein
VLKVLYSRREEGMGMFDGKKVLDSPLAASGNPQFCDDCGFNIMGS